MLDPFSVLFGGCAGAVAVMVGWLSVKFWREFDD